MGTIADKLNRVLESKSQIKDALISKGVEIPDDTPFRSYPSLVDNIQTGSDLNLAFGENPPEDTSKLWVELEPDKTSDAISVIDANNDTTVTTEGWQSRILNARIPITATDLTAAVVGSKVYLFGGSGPDGYLDTINVFDSETETITTLETKLQGPDCKMAAAVVGTDVYLFGGANDYRTGSRSNLIQKFDTETETLTQLDIYLPNAEIDINTFVFGNKIYLFGGTYGSSNTLDTTVRTFDTETCELIVLDITYPVKSITLLKVISVGSYAWIKYNYKPDAYTYRCDNVLFDPETQTFLDNDLPVFGYDYGMPVVCVGTKLCRFGSTLYPEGNVAFYTQDVIVFDYETGAEYMVSDSRLPIPYKPDSAAVVENKIYLFGGVSNEGKVDKIIEFDTGLSNAKHWSYISTESLGECNKLCTSVAVGTKIYLFGGKSPIDGTICDTIAIFDTITREYRVLDQHLTIPDYSIGAVVFEKTIYLTGGSADANYNTATLQAFDIETETISSICKVPRGSYYGCTVRVNDRIYMFSFSWFGGSGETIVTIYDLNTKTYTVPQWDKVSDGFWAAVPVGDKIYLFGCTTARDVYVFNTVDNTLVVSGIKMPRSMIDMRAVVVGDYAYLIGGRVGSSSYPFGKSDSIFRFDTRDLSIVELDVKLPRPELRMGITSIGNKIYLFKGDTNCTNDTSNIYILDTEKLNNPNQLLISTSSPSHPVTLLNTGDITLQIAVNSVYKGNSDGTCTKVPAHVYENGEWVEI